MTNNILVVYGTRYGQTAKIAQRIADLLTAYGDSVTLLNGDAVPREVAPRTFDGIIVGASIIVGRHQDCIRRFVRANSDALASMPSAFFSVSGSAASRDSQGREEARRMTETFLRETEWQPVITETIAGAMAFTKYNWLIRLVLKRISKKNGGPTDTSRDHELTDWTQVERFVERFSALLDSPHEGRLTPTPAGSTGIENENMLP